MARTARMAALAAAVLLAGVALSGCITVFPARSAVNTDPRASTMTFLPTVAYERQEDPHNECVSGTDTRTIFVPQLARAVLLDIHGHITSVGEPFASQDFRHLDFTVADGSGTVWAEIHLRNNDTDKKLTIEGPRPGGWTVAVSWNICDGTIPGIVRADDNFRFLVVVTQPA
jgi:hypothetical protein